MVDDVPKRDITPSELRQLCRTGNFHRPTAGFCPGYVQANLVILPRSVATDFFRFCDLNRQPCPLLEMLPAGEPRTSRLSRDADLRTDLPLYRIYRDGELVAERTDISNDWRDDFVSFLLGCSFTFESALLAAGLPIRHLEEMREDGSPKNVPMYRTDVLCRSAGVFSGPMVVSMRPMTPAQADEATRITFDFPSSHGAPVHRGDPALIGIADIDRPDWGDAVTIRPGEIPVFWACGVTPQAVVLASAPEIAITHSPGHMFVSDLRDGEIDEAFEATGRR